MIREHLDMDRKEFCQSFGFSLRTLEKWEQGIRQPEGPARAYLMVIAHDPQAVVHALSSH
jgi:putative transcriptional regulator